MLFNSYGFLVFFPLVCLIFFVVPKRYQYIWLLIASYFFYMCWNARYALLLLFSTAVTWCCALVTDALSRREAAEDSADSREKYRKLKRGAVALNFVLTLSILFFYKYFDFAVYNINQVLARFSFELAVPEFDIILPVGISFYTFQALGYSVDVYRGDVKVERNFLRYALFVSFFPQLVAGPIERSRSLLRQVNEEHSFDYDRMRDGLLLMLWGYFLKLVIADRAAIFVDMVYSDIGAFGGWYLIVASALFAVQIYCDFAGYSIIAMGAAKVMGFELMENFNCPYFSSSVAGFWRNWHISLTSWFRDYLYIPLGGSRKGKPCKYANVMAVFLISGLWHGASWHYVLWGGINGAYQVLGEMLRPVKDRLCSWFKVKRDSLGHKLGRVIATFILVDIAWVFFRAPSLSAAVRIFESMLTVHNPWILFDGSLYAAGLSEKSFGVLLLAIAILGLADLAKYRGVRLRALITGQNIWVRWSVYLASVMFVLIFGIWGAAFDASSFIYFQF